MAPDRIEEIKSVQFPIERRGGYDRRAVDAYLAELADWLEAGGADEARRTVIQQEMSRVGERTGTVLAAAQASADEVTVEAQTEADRLRAEVEQEAGATRSAADAYAAKTRTDADARLQTAEAEAATRTSGIEREIAELVRKRRDVVANLEQLNAELRLSIDGPGEQELDLPERVEAAVEVSEKAPTTVSEVVEFEPAEEPDTDERSPEEPDTEERDRRRRSVDSVDPPTEDTKLTELL
jgi:colicin import membrane protein